MSRTIMPVFPRSPHKAKIIGRLLAGYGELEFALASCLMNFTPTQDAGLQIIFRVRTESGRLEIADAILHGAFKRMGLSAQYADGIGAIRHCLKIRNQYAHCHWSYMPKYGLMFCILENHLKGPEVKGMKFMSSTLPLLKDQEAYFLYARDIFDFLSSETQKRQGQIKDNPFSMPAKRQPPTLYSP